MNNPLGVSPSNGKQGTTGGKEKIFWPRWESNPLVHGPEPLKCTNSRDQPRVVRIWSLFEGDSKNVWYQSEIGSSFVFLKHWNIAKAPFCMKTRLNFKSSIECIVRSGSFIYEIKLQERSVFYSFFMLDLDILQKRQQEIIHYEPVLAMHHG